VPARRPGSSKVCAFALVSAIITNVVPFMLRSIE
jgi:hypothetical protein